MEKCFEDDEETLEKYKPILVSKKWTTLKKLKARTESNLTSAGFLLEDAQQLLSYCKDYKVLIRLQSESKNTKLGALVLNKFLPLKHLRNEIKGQGIEDIPSSYSISLGGGMSATSVQEDQLIIDDAICRSEEEEFSGFVALLPRRDAGKV